MNKQIKFIDLGTMDYKEAWDFQQNLFDEIVQIKKENRKNNTNLKTPNYFLFVEHPHVYTLGKSGNYSNLLIDENQLKNKNASFYKINRGGDITYHGPGQIVGYPILDLENLINLSKNLTSRNCLVQNTDLILKTKIQQLNHYDFYMKRPL